MLVSNVKRVPWGAWEREGCQVFNGTNLPVFFHLSTCSNEKVENSRNLFGNAERIEEYFQKSMKGRKSSSRYELCVSFWHCLFAKQAFLMYYMDMHVNDRRCAHDVDVDLMGKAST